MDVIFDIDGTLADATHRLHWIKDMAFWDTTKAGPAKPNWDMFLADDLVAKDDPIPQTFQLLTSMLEDPQNYRVIFITGRKMQQRSLTYDWLRGDHTCPIRQYSWLAWERQTEGKGYIVGPTLYMRRDGDRRPSHVVKRDLLLDARMDGYNPTLVFEDRINDTTMWRDEGLLCCQVKEGDY